MEIKVVEREISGAPLEGENPLPKFRNPKVRESNISETYPENLKKDLGATVKVLPYTLKDRYSRKRIPMQIKACVLENKYLKAEFWPQYGGRLYSLFDKVNNRELLFKNPVFQPANLAIRDAWLSGGIEWNIGSLGHTYTTCDNIFAAVLKDEEGNDFFRMYEYERCTKVFWQMDFHLPENSKHLISHVKIINPFKEATTTYWWSNVAVPDTGNTRVLASSENIILFMNGKLDYTKLPYTDAMPGADLSYPSNSTRSFDYFFQPEDDESEAWEAAAYEDGLTFYEKSTAPLLYRKLFCWGNHRGGKHWQDYLSDPGCGYYAEIQAGIARSQLHDKVLGGNEIIEWTQCFGGMALDKDKLHKAELHEANLYCGENIDTVLGSDLLRKYDKICKKMAEIAVKEENLIHYGSGFGAVEIARMKKFNDGTVPKSMIFTENSIGEPEEPWMQLLETGVFPKKSPEEIPLSWMIDDKWFKLMENSKNRDWNILMHMGVAAYERFETGKIAAEAVQQEKRDKYIAEAKDYWMKSIELCPSVWVYRNLAVLEMDSGNIEKAEEYYEKSVNLDFIDYSVVVEYLSLLYKMGKYEKAWRLYEKLPETMKKVDRVMIVTAGSAVKLKKTEFLKEFFEYDHYAIAEGENSLTDIWFEYCAIVEGITIDEAWDKCPPPKNIDFRMSLDRKNKYRVEG